MKPENIMPEPFESAIKELDKNFITIQEGIRLLENHFQVGVINFYKINDFFNNEFNIQDAINHYDKFLIIQKKLLFENFNDFYILSKNIDETNPLDTRRVLASYLTVKDYKAQIAIYEYLKELCINIK